MEGFFCLYYYFCGLFSYLIKGNYVLLMLLSLEFMMVSLFLFLFFNFGMLCGIYYLLLFYLIVVVCEGAMGLSLLVGFVRFYGSDMMYLF